MFLARRSCPFLLLPFMVAILILASAFPAAVLADDEVPTPGATPVVADTPDAPPLEEGSTNSFVGSDDVNLEDATSMQSGVEVAISEDDQRISAEGNMSPNVLATTMPIWCPIGIEPIAGQHGCTAEFGSISLLLDYLNSNSLGDQGRIWIPELSSSDNVDTSSEQSQTTDQGAADDVNEGTSGVNVIILDNSGNSLPLDGEMAANALLNGQPVWCPDGLTPSSSENCTSSAGSLGLLVSMMENGSLEDGAIYIQAPPSDAVVSEHASLPPPQANAAVDGDGQEIPQATDLPANEDDPSTKAILHDPIWCPNTAPSPTPGAGGCTPSQSNLETLIAFLMLPGNEPGADGKIWIQQGIDTSSTTDVIDGNVFTNWKNYSLSLQGGWIGGILGDPSITGNTTFSQAISVTNWLNDVFVSDIIVQNTTSTGLHVLTTGNIGLNNITSTGNALDGVFVHNDAGGTGTVTITGTNDISNNLDDGLVVRSNGYISANQINASGNGDVGAYLKNNTGSGNISLTGTNVFSNNGANPAFFQFDTGLKLDSNGSINIDNITASNNLMGGTDFGTATGSVILTGNNFFIANGGAGLDISISSGGTIDLQNITATGNALAGATLFIGSGAGSGLVNIHITGGVNVFNNNSSDGLVVSTYGDIVLSDMDASGNTGSASGARLGTACNITINSSTLNTNAQYGFDDSLSLPTYPASIALNSVTLVGNTLGAYLVNNPNTVIPAAFPYPCTVLPGAPAGNSSLKNVLVQPIALQLNTINLAGGANPVDLNCTEFSGTVLVLANGDQVKYMCPTLGQVSLIHVEEAGANFPGALPTNLVFTSAMETHLSEAGIDQPLTSGDLIVSFVIPVDIAGFDFAILYFDGSNWLDLSTATFSDGKLVSNGGFKTENGMFEATTNFPGTFVLVRK